MEELILASASAARAQLLSRAGVRFEVDAARIDEPALRASMAAEKLPARDMADALAEAKALKVSGRRPGPLVIGADQILALEGEIISKPADTEEARLQLGRLSARQHTLFTAAVVAQDGLLLWRHVTAAHMHVRTLSEAWIDGYLERNGDRVSGSVGAYHIEEEGVRLFDRIDGDMFAIMGLPLVPLLSWLTMRGSLPG